MFSTETFRKKLMQDHGPAPVNRFKVQFLNIPVKVPSNLEFRVEQAELPGKNILTVEDKQLYGPVRKIAYGQSFVDTTMTFVCSSKGWEEKDFFNAWQDSMIDPNLHDANYYDDYTGEIHLNTYDESNLINQGIIFEEAFPLMAGAINLGMDQNTTYARLTVTFAYRRWKLLTTKYPGGLIASGAGMNDDLTMLMQGPELTN